MQACRYKLKKIHQHNRGHMTKMATMPIYDKNPSKIFFPETTGPILMKLCMKYDPGLTLTYSMAHILQLRLLYIRIYSLEIIASCDLEFD